jgi:hypothetical protein
MALRRAETATPFTRNEGEPELLAQDMATPSDATSKNMLPEDSLKVTELALPPEAARLATRKNVESADAVGRAIELKPAFETLGTEMLGRPFSPELESVGRNPLVGCVMCFPLPDRSAQ